MRRGLLLLSSVLLSACLTSVGAPPAALLGTFEDDYGSTHRVSAGEWRHGAHSTYQVLKWRSDSQYFIARNAETNRSGGGLYTRIDWMQLEDMAPYTFGFCLSAFEAATAAEAESAKVANRATPRTGCNGFPFSRLKRAAVPLDSAVSPSVR